MPQMERMVVDYLERNSVLKIHTYVSDLQFFPDADLDHNNFGLFLLCTLTSIGTLQNALMKQAKLITHLTITIEKRLNFNNLLEKAF